MADQPVRVLVLGAHPDDAEFHAGGLIARHCELGNQVRIVSVTNGESGHHEMRGEELAKVRREEAAAAGKSVGAEYVTWDFADGSLTPSLEVRWKIIREIRQFDPDLVLTHRINDYHPDHRAVGQAVQDASYMVTVPPVVPDVPALRRDPVVAYMVDLFTRPCPIRADVVFDATEYANKILGMLACHRSQVYQWLPYNQGVLDQVPEDEADRPAWLRGWVTKWVAPRVERFRDALTASYGQERAGAIEFCEVYEISEYAASMDDAQKTRLFPV